MVARPVEMDDWVLVRSAWAGFQAGKYASVIEDVDRLLQPTFVQSLPPNSPLKLFGLFDGSGCHALACVQEFHQPVPSGDGWSFHARPYTFVRSVFALPEATRQGMRQLDEVVVLWAKSRGHFQIQGNCRLNFPERLAKAYGYIPQAVIFGKRLEE